MRILRQEPTIEYFDRILYGRMVENNFDFIASIVTIRSHMQLGHLQTYIDAHYYYHQYRFQ